MGRITQLRQLLVEKFPGMRTHAEQLQPPRRNYWFTGIPQLDESAGLCKGGITEVVSEYPGAGSTFLLCSILQRATEQRQLSAFVDGSDSLDVTQLDSAVLSRLLWVRCRSVQEALKATDLLLRDGNFPLVLLDLAGNPPAQFRNIPSTTWYRLQRIVEQSSTVCIALTPRPMVAPAEARIFLRSRFTLNVMEQAAEELLGELNFELAEEAAALQEA